MILLTPDERDELLETPTTVDELVEEIAKRQLRKVYAHRLVEFIDGRDRECIAIDKEDLLKEVE